MNIRSVMETGVKKPSFQTISSLAGCLYLPLLVATAICISVAPGLAGFLMVLVLILVVVAVSGMPPGGTPPEGREF